MTALLVIALGFGVYVWYTIQKYNVPMDEVREVIEEIKEKESEPVPETVLAPEPSEPMVIPAASLTPAQQQMLEAFGYTDGITITPEMIICAEKALETGRLDEIVKGGAPTPFEAMKLIPCFKS